MRKSLIRAGVVAASVASLAALSAPAGSTPAAPKPAAPSKVYVVHGLPLDKAGTKVDVYAGAAGGATADAGLIANDFTFKQVAGPLSLAPASYTVFVAAPTASNDGVLSDAEVLFSKTLDVPSGKNLSAIASFDASSNPTINVFENDVTKAPSGGGRISIRHAAAAPEVVADLGYYPWSRTYSFFSKRYGPVANGQQGTVTTVAGPYDVVIRVAANKARVAAIPRFAVQGSKLRAVYVVGKPGESLNFIVQTINL